jgi:transcriptional regulator with XRE-family HTH domain
MDKQDLPKRRSTIPLLRTWRLYRLLSQRELSQRAKVGEVTVIRIEQGEQANELTVHKLARGLGITAHQLLHEEPPEETTIDGAA